MSYSNTKPLKIRSVSELTERFVIPNYQRGYRWERSQVRKLLDDVNSHGDKSPYYLQPIVVSLNDDGTYCLVDGQQRLTTIYLIRQFLTSIKELMSGSPYNPLASISTAQEYSIEYQTRTDSEAFLKNIKEKTLEDAQVTPDYLYMWHAYKEIEKWIGEHSHEIANLAKAINECVKIIWYELPSYANKETKFADINIGKIPLTNSELVKALFMRNNNVEEENQIKQEKLIIIDQWDGIERELRDLKFWGFLTRESQNKYDTLIDLVFNIIANKGKDEKDDFFTFLYFDKSLANEKGVTGKECWDKVFLSYQRLRDWYEDRYLYHRIGYIITQSKDNNTLTTLFEESKEKTHEELKSMIKNRIKECIDFGRKKANVERLSELKYGPNSALIESILTLFNVLTTDNLDDETERYPFYRHNDIKSGWSLEHIHAQNSEGLNTAEKWRTRIGDLLD